MNLVLWVCIWLFLVFASAFVYWVIARELVQKSKRLATQLEKTEQTLRKFESETASRPDPVKSVSALEQDPAVLVTELHDLRATRRRAKAAKARRLIRDLKKLQRESQ